MSHTRAPLERNPPPPRRHSETVAVSIGATSYYFIVGRRADGSICDVFINTGKKEGSGIQGWASALGLVASHFIQLGGDVRVIAEALRHTSFEPAGYVNPPVMGIEEVDSIVDAFAQFLLAAADETP